MITAATLQEYEQVSVSYVDEEGYPVTLPAKVKLEDGKVLIELPEGYRTISLSGRRVNVILNHITPIPGGGYTDRRYFVIRGVARMSPEGVELDVERTYRWNEKEVPFPEYVEVSTPRAKGYLERLGLKLGVNFKPRIGAFWTFFRVVRFPFLSATAVPVATGAAVALYRGAFDPLLLLLTFLGLAFIHMALNVANDYFDTKLGADPANRRPTPFSGGSRSLQYGLISESEAKLLFTSFFAIGSAIGLYLAFTRGLVEILTLMGLGLFLSYFYTAPPFKLAYRGLGELAVGTGFGPVIVLGSYFVQTRSLSVEAFLASVPIGLLIMLILYVNEIPDAPYDRAAGKMHLVARFTEKQTLRFLAASFVALYLVIALIPVLRLGPWLVLAGLATIPTAQRIYRMVKETFGNQYAMIPVLALNVRNAVVTGALVAAGYALGAILGL